MLKMLQCPDSPNQCGYIKKPMSCFPIGARQGALRGNIN